MASKTLPSGYIRELAALAILAAIVSVLAQEGLLGPLDRFMLDALAGRAQPKPSDHTAIFDIDDDSYSADFGGISPLSEAVLARLVSAALVAHARAVVVDLETDRGKVELGTRVLMTGEGAAFRPEAIVWARDAEPCSAATAVSCVRPIGELTSQYGLAVLLADSDGVIRRYRPQFSIAEGGGCDCRGATHDSLPRAAIRAAQVASAAADDQPLVLNWSAGRYTIRRVSAGQVLRDSSRDFWRASQVVAGRIVFIGATFRQAREGRLTPIGELAGVEVMAQITEMELAGGGLKQLGHTPGVALDLVCGAALLFLNAWLGAHTSGRRLLNVVLVVAIPTLASVVLYRYSLLWVSVSPLLVGAWAHQRLHGLLEAPAEGNRTAKSRHGDSAERPKENSPGSTTERD